MIRNLLLVLLWFVSVFVVSFGGYHFGQGWGMALALFFFLGIDASITLTAEDIVDRLKRG